MEEVKNDYQNDYTGIPALTLESMRVRLAQLVHSLNTLNSSVTGAKLPPWPALHQQFNVALLQLESVISNLDVAPDATQRSVVFPTDTFPSASLNGLLPTLLRKKVLPEVEDWINEGTERVKTDELDLAADDAFCDWAWETAESITEINVKPLQLKAPASSDGWHLDKTVEVLAGNQ